MTTISKHIFELLDDDIVSHGLLLQCVQENRCESDRQVGWQDVVSELLSMGVEIGEARSKSPEYVEFIAWKGTVDERVKRASVRINEVAHPDQEFAYWLCLRQNVDRFGGN